MTPGRVRWVIIDAASWPIACQLLEQGRLPALQRLVDRGLWAPLQPGFPNCQTATSLASLVTGRDTLEHGVTGHRVPSCDPDRPVTHSRLGFASESLRSTPIWSLAEAHGQQAGVVHLPWAEPLVHRLDAYARPLAPPAAVRMGDLPQAEGNARVLAIGNAVLHVRPGSDAVDIASTEGCGRISISDLPTFSTAVTIAPGVATYLDAWHVEGQLIIAHTGAWALRCGPADDAQRVLAATGPFVGVSLGDAYRRGALGRRTLDGGHGQAERAWAPSLHRMASHCQAAWAYAARHWEACDLIVGYQPIIDDVQHELFRVVAGPPSPKSARALLESCYARADEHIRQLLDHAGDADTVVVCSDHGFLPTRHFVHVNVALERAGLARFLADGALDLEHTRAVFHPAQNGSLWINQAHRPQGRVEEADVEATLHQAMVALRHIRDPASGRPVIRDIQRPPSPQLGHALLFAADGFELRAGRGPGPVVTDTPKGGHHMSFSPSPWLRGFVAAQGPRIATGTRPGALQHRDVHKLVHDALGLPLEAR